MIIFMNQVKYPNLFKPIALGGTLFRNRIFAAPTGFMDNSRFGEMPPEAASYYERKAKGGAAAVTLGVCVVDSKYGCSSPCSICLDDPLSRNSFCRIVDAVRRHGAVCSAELCHNGTSANRYKDMGKTYGPVDGVDNGYRFYEMPEDVILYTIDKFAEGAATAKSYGFGMVMLHAGHGWFISQFLSPKLNTRKDKWGGPDIENRSRITVEILKAIRKAVGPGFPVEVRISGSECYDGGYGIEEGIKFAKQIEPYIDLLHVSAGSHEVEEVFGVTHPSLFMPDGCNVQYAEEIKKHVKCPVATVGALADPDLMENIIASGKADVVEVARGLIADPDLPKKIRTGRGAEINTCMRCLHCFSVLHTAGQFYCAINPESGREAEMNLAIPPAQKKKVLIAGGGVAGMQAALTCAGRGHEVILCEKSGRLGGALRCEENVPFKLKLAKYLDRQAEKLAAAGVDIRLGTEVTPDYADRERADVIIAALGARPIKPQIPGIDGENVLSAEEAYVSPEKVGSSVAIIGAGLSGTELAIYLSSLGRKVTVVEVLGEISHGGNIQHLKALNTEIRKCGIDMRFDTKALEVTAEGLISEGPDGMKTIKADTVIYAIGQRPLWDETESLNYCAPDFYMIGDCVAPRNIMNATSMAFSIARNIT